MKNIILYCFVSKNITFFHVHVIQYIDGTFRCRFKFVYQSVYQLVAQPGFFQDGRGLKAKIILPCTIQ